MKKKWFLLLSILLSFSTTSFALSVPVSHTFVTDRAQILKEETVERLEKDLSVFNASTSVEMVVLTLPSLEGETVEQVAEAVFREWGIGKKGKDNGVLLLIVPKERVMRIEVGYGLEGVLTDAKSHLIIDSVVVPSFKNGDYDKGVIDGVIEITALILGESGNSTEETEPQTSVSVYVVSFLLLLFVSLSLFLFGVRVTLKSVPLFAVGFFFSFTQLTQVSFTSRIIISFLAGFVALILFHTNGRFSSGGFGGGAFGGRDRGGFTFGGGRSGGGGASSRW